jgi:hypothetical protein
VSRGDVSEELLGIEVLGRGGTSGGASVTGGRGGSSMLSFEVIFNHSFLNSCLVQNIYVIHLDPTFHSTFSSCWNHRLVPSLPIMPDSLRIR